MILTITYSEINIDDYKSLADYTKTQETIDRFIDAIEFIAWFKNDRNKEENFSRTVLCIIDSGK